MGRFLRRDGGGAGRTGRGEWTRGAALGFEDGCVISSSAGDVGLGAVLCAQLLLLLLRALRTSGKQRLAPKS